ncbi:hypothetical protein GCM10007320_34900 [Pseudorhodoferax aquiterrae]|uniref:Uncharacterized protein n=2 Tax=Pseudorhodoferax aquiterrae TaxID=747304 RepID=A0ABQ3G418_9BURK|nr:hypothetical protein GCM10007320_34900 [Pseudorhodoferax aquiterrae]
MEKIQELSALVDPFLSRFDSVASDQLWAAHSQTFRGFWDQRIKVSDGGPISDDECDAVIRILDRNGKGNTKTTEAVARAMIPQDVWRRLFRTFRTNNELRDALDRVLVEDEPGRKAHAIDALYRLNAGEKNNLTGPTGTGIGALLAAYDPFRNLSVISLKDRRAILEHLGQGLSFDWKGSTIGETIVWSNRAIRESAAQLLGLSGSARTVARFFYDPAVQPLWKGVNTVHVAGRRVHVEVPTEAQDGPDRVDADADLPTDASQDPAASSLDPVQQGNLRESMQIQALLARMGAMMGFYIWLPKADRARVLQAWTPGPGQLLDALPLGYDALTTKTIEQIDVLWLRRRSIARAFEVEHTTSVYSGLLRMADLIALQPDINVKLHIVASSQREDKVLAEISRPVFAMLEPKPLSDMCSFLTYESIREIADLRHLAWLSDQVLEDYEITAPSSDDGA